MSVALLLASACDDSLDLLVINGATDAGSPTASDGSGPTPPTNSPDASDSSEGDSQPKPDAVEGAGTGSEDSNPNSEPSGPGPDDGQHQPPDAELDAGTAIPAEPDSGDDIDDTPPAQEPDAGQGEEEPFPPIPDEWVSGLDERPPEAALSFPDVLEMAAPGWTPVEAFPALTFDFPTVFEAVPGTDQIFVAELNGRIYSFENDPGVTEKHLVLDISDHTQGLDCGLLGMAFHPEFNDPSSPNRGYIYVQYPFKADPIVDQFPPGDTQTRLRLARFTVDLETLQIDPASELVLIDQDDEHIAHQGGPLFFHPDDGFLYYAVGDEGSHDCVLDNCQMIDKDLFSGVLRIDVDMRGGDISHPIPRQPASGTTANYYIPNDNPFVGVPGVLEEFYAIGLREPHRMTFDPVDKLAWIGDVGQQRIEEINVLQRAANYQWAVLEGSLQVFTREVPAEPIGTWTDPLLALGHEEAASITGGYVYRGSKNPSLYGKYIFGDFVTGSIWALSYSYDGTSVTPLERELLLTSQFARTDGIVSFGVDASGELYILPAGQNSKIYSLARTEGFTNAPTRLSETGIFVDTADAQLSASPGLLGYDVQSPLWSDGAVKERWVSLPEGQTVAFSESGNWSFPDRSVLVKHFELALDESHPEQRRRLETRVLVQGANSSFYGLTYRWNEAGTDADLLMEREIEPIDVTLADGQTRSLKYFYPGPNDCAACHTDVAGPVLGVRTSQLNHEVQFSETGRTANQLFTWGQAGILDVAPSQEAVEQLPRLADPENADAPIEERVRSYWASNCSMCHRGPETAAGIEALWDARHDVPLEEQGVIYGPSLSALQEDAYVVVPGDLAKSVLYQRSSSIEPGVAMPPLGRSAVDPNYGVLLKEWIESLED